MAQTGYTPIQIYSSSTGGNTPAAGNLTNSTLGSELAINITDGKLFYKDNAGVVQVIAWKVTPATAGGTGQTSYAVGDLLYADSTTSLAKLADVATGNALISGGVGVAPSWGKIGLTTHVSGTLPVANGGTGLASWTAKGVVYASGTTTLTNGTGLQFDGSNLGINVAPSAWLVPGNIEFSGKGTFTGSSSISSNGLFMSANAYYGSSGWTYIGTAVASQYLVGSGGHYWYSANSGTAGSAITWTLDWSLSSGNFVQGTAAKGINFTANTPAAGMTSQLLNWYEEGTYTATLTPSTSGSILMVSAYDLVQYTRIGRLVTVSAQIRIDSVSSPVGTYIKLNLPFTIASLSELAGRGGGCVNYNGTVIPMFWETGNNFVYLSKDASTAATGQNIYFSFSYVA